MYTIRRDPSNAYHYSQSWTVQCQQQQQQQLIFHNRQMIKTKQQTIWSTKNSQKNDFCFMNFPTNDSQYLKTFDVSSHDEPLPVYRAPCTFQNSLETTTKETFNCGSFRRSPLSPSSCCVPDVYSPGSSSSGNCSPPPPSSNLPPPPSEWLH